MTVLFFPDNETGKVPRRARCLSPNHKGPRRDVREGEATSACTKCGRFTCSACEGTDHLPDMCDDCWSSTVRDVCFRCEKTEVELNAAGRQLYFCDAKKGACPNQCCSECSDTCLEPDTRSAVVYCLACADDYPKSI